MIKKPTTRKPGIFSFLLPLKKDVWVSVCAGCVLVALGMFVIARVSPSEWQIDESDFDELVVNSSSSSSTGRKKVHRDFNLMNSSWFSFASFMNQGVDFSPRAPGSRILASTWWLFTLIMIAYYTATLAASLTVESLVTPINSWEDLKKKDIKYGTVSSGSTRNFFKTTDLPPFNYLGKVMEEDANNVLVHTVEDGVRRVQNGKNKYAFVLESKTNEYLNSRKPCDTMMVGEPFGNKGYGIATPRGNVWKELINDAVLRMREDETLAGFYKKWWIEQSECPKDEERKATSELDMINVAGVFYILVAGLVIALLTSLIEFYYIARQETLKNKRSLPVPVGQQKRIGPVHADYKSLNDIAARLSGYSNHENHSTACIRRTMSQDFSPHFHYSEVPSKKSDVKPIDRQSFVTKATVECQAENNKIYVGTSDLCTPTAASTPPTLLPPPPPPPQSLSSSKLSLPRQPRFNNLL